MKNFHSVRLWVFGLMLTASQFYVLGQTQLGLGDLAFVHFDRQNTPRQFSFIARTLIDANTVFYVTNNQINNSNNTFAASGSGESIIEVIVDQPLSPGEVFTIDYGSGNVSSTTVTASFKEGSDFVFTKSGDRIWVYTAPDPTKPRETGQFITGVLWKGSGTGQSIAVTPTVFQSAPGNLFLFDLEVNGQSEKCGCVRDDLSTYSLTNISTFYIKNNWQTTTSSTTSYPCDVTPFKNAVQDPAKITYDIYRYGHPDDGGSPRWTGGTATQSSTPAWTNLGINEPDWSTETAVRRVEIHQDYTLSDQRTFTCASLFIASGKTLTLDPGAILAVGQTLDNNNGTIHCKSGMVGSPAVKQFAQIAPTNAQLNGTFRYDVLINNPEWHHFMSPIVSTLGNIQFIDATNNQTSSFTLSYTGPTANVYRWNVGDAQNNAGWALTSGSNADFSAEPYTIFFPQSVLPLIMRVEGAALLADPNVDQQQSAGNGAGVPSSPGYGAPGWNIANVNGWNFYGNPYLSFISSQRTVANFGSNMTSVSHPVYTYQPFRNSSTNVANNYHTFNGTTGDEQANNIPPFQAFFMQHVNPGGGTPAGNNNGPKFGKRSRLSQNPTAGSFVQFRTTSAAKTKLALDLYHQSPNPEATLYLDLRDDMQHVERNIYKDAVFNGDVHKMFGIYFDSSCYVIKCAPNHLDSLHQKVAVVYRNHGASFSIGNHPDFNTDYESFLYDRYTGTMHNLSQGTYSFVNDTTQQDYRFDWFLAPKNLGVFSAFERSAPSWVWWSAVDNTVALFTQVKRQEEQGHIMVFDLNGKMLFEQTGVIHQMRLPAQRSGKQAIVVINREKAIKIQFP